MQKIEISFTSIKGRNIVPISEHCGPVLKLTKKEKLLIDSMKKEINEKQLDVYKVSGLMAKATTEKLKYIYNDILVHLTTRIEILQDKIKDIKTNRFKIQKEKWITKKK